MHRFSFLVTRLHSFLSIEITEKRTVFNMAFAPEDIDAMFETDFGGMQLESMEQYVRNKLSHGISGETLFGIAQVLKLQETYRMPWVKAERVKTLKSIYVLLERDPNAIQPQIRLGVRTQLSQHPFTNSIPHYRMQECLRAKIRLGGAIPKGQSLDVTLAPFDSTIYREQQERNLREMERKPCAQVTLPRKTRTLELEGHHFNLEERFAKRIPDIPSGIVRLLERIYGREAIVRLTAWCHPGEQLPASTSESEKNRRELPGEAISDAELDPSTSSSPMDVEQE